MQSYESEELLKNEKIFKPILKMITARTIDLSKVEESLNMNSLRKRKRDY